MEKRVRISWLLDFYSKLITDKQRSIMDQHYNQDLSLSEIAQGWNVSRQAVMDSLKRGEAQLNSLEAKLGILKRYEREISALERCKTMLGLLEQEIGKNELIDRLRTEIDGLSTDWEDTNGV